MTQKVADRETRQAGRAGRILKIQSTSPPAKSPKQKLSLKQSGMSYMDDAASEKATRAAVLPKSSSDEGLDI